MPVTESMRGTERTERRKKAVARGILLTLLAALAVVGLSEFQHRQASGPAFAGPAVAHAPSLPAKAAQVQSRAPAGGRQVIEQGTAQLVVPDVGRAMGRLTRETLRVGGFIGSSSVSGQGADQTGNLTLRVPESDFGRFMGSLAGVGHITRESQAGNDVTTAVNDLSIQIRAKETEITGYETLYQKAASVSSMLQIQQALSQAEENLLVLEQEASSLHQQVTLATVYVTLTAVPVPGGHGVRLGSVLRRSLVAMLGVGKALLAGLVWILPWSALAALLLLPLNWWRRHRARGAT